MNLINFDTDTDFILTLKYFLDSRILIWLSFWKAKRLLMLGRNLEKRYVKLGYKIIIYQWRFFYFISNQFKREKAFSPIRNRIRWTNLQVTNWTNVRSNRRMISALKDAKNIHTVEQKYLFWEILILIWKQWNLFQDEEIFTSYLQAVSKAVKGFSKTQYKSVN